MKIHTLLAGALAAAALMTTALPAAAETEADMSFDGMVAMKRIDKNKDGMVSKQEFMDMMSAVWDARAKKMKMSGDRMSAENFKEILMYLKAGS